MTGEQLTTIREALEAAHYTLRQLPVRAAFGEDRLNTIAKVEKALDGLHEVLTDPAAKLQLCDRCKKILPFNGDWYCGLCPKCADETDGREEI